jgi:FkbM family methyltransferase
MHDDFLILSIGRTATAYFAEVLGVDHEPAELNGSAVSPKHLFRMTTGWKIPKNYRVVILVRNAEAQMLSILNRAAALGAGKVTMFREKLPDYLRILNELVRDGAQIYSSDALLAMDVTELSLWAREALGVNSIKVTERPDTFPIVLTELPPWAKVAAAKMQKHYDAWLNTEALEFDPDEIDPTRHEIIYGGMIYRMDYVFPAEIAALRAKKSGQFQELPVLQWLAQRELKGTYVDIGAHIGNHSLFFANHCPSDSVISIEAHPQIAELCGENLRRNMNPVKEREWFLIRKAAWSKSAETVKMAPIPHNNAGHTCIKDDGVTPVETIALDDLALTNVSVIKIDVEDVEVQVLEGAMQTITRDRPVIIAERHTAEQLAEFEGPLLELGYKRTVEWPGIHTYAWLPGEEPQEPQ